MAERPITHTWLTEEEEKAFERDPDFVAEGYAIRFMEQVLGLMKEQEMSQKDLAQEMGVSPPYMSRLFSAPPNLTLRSLVQLKLALSAEMTLGIYRKEPMAGLLERPHEVPELDWYGTAAAQDAITKRVQDDVPFGLEPASYSKAA